MSQSKKNSFIEACVNTVIGFVLTLLLSHPIYWLCDVHISHVQVMGATLLFTIISILRGYIIKRFFENNIATIILRKINNIKKYEISKHSKDSKYNSN